MKKWVAVIISLGLSLLQPAIAQTFISQCGSACSSPNGDPNTVTIDQDVSLSGVSSFEGITTIKSTGNDVRTIELTNLANLQIDGIDFINVQLRISDRNPTSDVRITNNVFYTSWGARIVSEGYGNRADFVVVANSSTTPEGGYLQISDNIFLRQREMPCNIDLPDIVEEYACYASNNSKFSYIGGDAIKLHNVFNGYVARNVIGGVNDDIWSLNILSSEIRNRLSDFSIEYGVLDKNAFESGITINNPDVSGVPPHGLQVIVEGNIINGDDTDENLNSSIRSENYNRDHAVYFGRYNGVRFCGNYVVGWPETGHGGAKFRNSNNTFICNNHFMNVPILMYAYVDVSNEFPDFTNAYVSGNYVSSNLSDDQINNQYMRPILFYQNCDPNSLDTTKDCEGGPNEPLNKVSVHIFDNTLETGTNEQPPEFIRAFWKGVTSNDCPDQPAFYIFNNQVPTSNIAEFSTANNVDCDGAEPAISTHPKHSGFEISDVTPTQPLPSQ